MIDFNSLKPRAKPNAYLACTETFCPSATIDEEAPFFPVAPQIVKAAFLQAIAGEARLEQAASAPDGLRLHYIQRSRLFRFADDITVAFMAEGQGTRVLMHSAARLGHYDFGVNKARLRRWLDKLAEQPDLKTR